MQRHRFYTTICGLFFILMLIGFILPLIIRESAGEQTLISITGIQRAGLPLFLLFFGGIPLSFFVYQKTEEDEKDFNWPLASFAGLMGLIAFIFLIRGLIASGTRTDTLSYAPFYTIVIACLFGAFYWKRDALYNVVRKRTSNNREANHLS
jgi:L-asparagine transporter-like permease